MLSKFITQQRAPNCVEKTWNCLLLDSIDDRSDYKKLTLDNRFHTIVFYYLNHTDELASNPMHTRRLLSASTNFLRMVDVHFERGTIKEPEYLHAVATIRDIIGRLSLSTAKQPKDPQALITLDDAKLTKGMVERRTVRLDHLKTKIQPEKSDTEAPSNITSVDPTLGKGITWPDLCINLYQLRTKKFDSRGLAFQIEFFMQNIRHLKKTTPNLTPHSAQQSLTQLLELLLVYIPAVNQLDMQQSCATQNTLMEMLAIAYQLAVQSDQKNVLQHYGLYYDHFERQSSLFLYAIQDPDQLEHRNELISFFSSLPKNWQLFDFETEHFDEEKFTAGLTPESKLYQDYLPDITQEDRKKYYLNSYSLPQELNYIKYLKSIAGLTTSIFKSKTKLSTLKEFYWPVYRIIKLDNSLQFACGYSNWDTDPKQESYELEYIPTSPEEDATKQTNPILDSFSHSALGNHDIWTLLTENQWLEKTSGKLSESDHRERTLLSPLCEPSIEISLIFRIWTDYVQHLSHAELRPLFENVFFKTLNTRSQTISPLFLQIVEDPYFGSRVGLLTHEGFRHVKHLPFREEHLSSFYGFLSVMRMRSSMLYLWRTKNPKHELSEDLQTQYNHLLEWINRFLDSPTSTGALKTELLLAKTSLLMEKSLKEMSTEERVELMVTYCSLHPRLGSSQSGESPVLRREIQRRWLTMVPEWVDFFKTDASANDFLSLCIYEISKNKVNIDQNCVTSTKVAFSDWWIDLGLAQIGNSIGLWDNHQIDLPKDRKIERLFQKRKHQLTAFGNSVSFNDPIWAEIQVDVKTLTIERNFRGKKYTYIDSLDPRISNYQLNSSLIFDHALWICEDDSPHRMMICDLKTGKMTHKSNKEGSIFAVDSSNEFIINGIDAFSIQDEVKAFESAEHMSCYRTLEGEWLLEFPRFKTSVGGVLRFIFDQKLGRWNYAENPSLYLDPNPIRNWGFDRCLNLVSQDGCSRTVLVAEGKISSTGYNPHCAIELPIDAEDGHKEEISYYEYEVVDDALQPQSFNGQLYLGSLTLACKQYQEAFAIFQKLSLSETPDKTSWKLFERLMSSSENVLDHSPNHTAVLFHVFYFFSQIDPYAPLFQNNSFLESVNKLFKKYYCHLANVESPLLLTREQELGVIKTFRGEAEYNGRWKELSSHPFEEEERMTEDSYPFSLGICHGKFPRTITHQHNQETLKNEFYKLLNDPDFLPRLQFIYSKPSDIDWRRTVYSLATQNSHTLTDQFILFAAFLHERYAILPDLPSKTADDATISKWWRDSINLFIYNHHHEDCYTSCNHVALEFKPTLSRIDTQNKVGLPPQTEQPFSPIVLPELGQIHQKDLLLPLQAHYLVQPPLPMVQEEDGLSQMNQISDGQDKQEEQSLPLLLPIEIKDPVYHNSIQERLSFYAKDRAIAANNKLLKPHFKPASEDFITDIELEHLKQELEGLTERCLKQEEHLTAFILEMANRKPTNPLEFAKYHTKKMGHSLKDRNILEICQTLVQGDWNSTLRQMNPYLNADEIDHLKATVIDYMTVKTNRQQVETVLRLLDSYLETQDPALLDLTAAALSESRVYNPEVDHFSLLFETMTGFRLRLQQAQIIQTILPLLVKDPKIAGIAFQGMMNTG